MGTSDQGAAADVAQPVPIKVSFGSRAEGTFVYGTFCQTASSVAAGLFRSMPMPAVLPAARQASQKYLEMKM